MATKSEPNAVVAKARSEQPLPPELAELTANHLNLHTLSSLQRQKKEELLAQLLTARFTRLPGRAATLHQEIANLEGKQIANQNEINALERRIKRLLDERDEQKKQQALQQKQAPKPQPQGPRLVKTAAQLALLNVLMPRPTASRPARGLSRPANAYAVLNGPRMAPSYKVAYAPQAQASRPGYGGGSSFAPSASAPSGVSGGPK